MKRLSSNNNEDHIIDSLANDPQINRMINEPIILIETEETLISNKDGEASAIGSWKFLI